MEVESEENKKEEKKEEIKEIEENLEDKKDDGKIKENNIIVNNENIEKMQRVI